MTLQTGREQKTRHVSFADVVRSSVDTEVERFCSSETQQVSSKLLTDSDAMTVVKHVEPVHDMSMLHRQVERDCSSEPQLEAVRMSSHRQVEQVDSLDAHGESSCMVAEMADLDADDTLVVQSFLDACTLEQDDVFVILQTDGELQADAVQDTSVDSAVTEVERQCSSETQQLSSEFVQREVEPACYLGTQTDLIDMESFVFDCTDAELSVMQSYLDMLNSEHVDVSSLDGQEMHVADTPCQSEMPIARDIYVDACSVELAGSASVASAFGGLMYEMLISRSDIAAAVGAFVVDVVSRLVTDAGIVHGGAMQVLCRHLHEVCDPSSSVWTYTGLLLSCQGQTDAHDHRQPVGVG